MTTQGKREDPGSVINNGSLPAYIVNRHAVRMSDWVAERYAVKQVTDEDTYAHKIASRKAAAARVENFNFSHKNADQLQLTNEYFDVVLILNLLHCLANWAQHVTTSYNTLPPGGVCTFSTIGSSDGFTLIRFPFLFGRLVGILPQLNFFTRNDLKLALINTGLDIDYKSVPERITAVFLVTRKPW